MFSRGEDGDRRVEAMRWPLLLPMPVRELLSSLPRENETLTGEDFVGDANGLSGKL